MNRPLRLDSNALAASFTAARRGDGLGGDEPVEEPSASTRRGTGQGGGEAESAPAAQPAKKSPARKRTSQRAASRKKTSPREEAPSRQAATTAADPASTTRRSTKPAAPRVPELDESGQPEAGDVGGAEDHATRVAASTAAAQHKVNVVLPVDVVAKIRDWELTEFRRTRKRPNKTRLFTEAVAAIPDDPTEWLQAAAKLDRDGPSAPVTTRIPYSEYQRLLEASFTREPPLPYTALVALAVVRHLDSADAKE